MNNILLTIIIPVYNTEKYIVDCVKSIQSSRENLYQIILINDGSTDSSLAVCKELVNEYKMIKLIASENKGVASARNLGIQNADGEWILFIDSDDYLEEGAVDYILNYLKNNSYKKSIMYRFGMHKDYYKNEELIERRKLDFSIFNDNDFKDKRQFTLKDDFVTLFNNDIFDSACLCLFNRRVIHENHICFVEGMRVREDSEFLLHYLQYTDNVEIWNTFLYHYRIEENDSYALRRETSISDIKHIADRYSSVIENIDVNKEKSKRLVSYFIYQLFYGGIVHIAMTRTSQRCKTIYKYIDAVTKNKELFSLISAATASNKFHKLLLMLFRKRLSVLLSVLCFLRFRIESVE